MKSPKEREEERKIMKKEYKKGNRQKCWRQVKKKNVFERTSLEEDKEKYPEEIRLNRQERESNYEKNNKKKKNEKITKKKEWELTLKK